MNECKNVDKEKFQSHEFDAKNYQNEKFCSQNIEADAKNY